MVSSSIVLLLLESHTYYTGTFLHLKTPQQWRMHVLVHLRLLVRAHHFAFYKSQCIFAFHFIFAKMFYNFRAATCFKLFPYNIKIFWQTLETCLSCELTTKTSCLQMQMRCRLFKSICTSAALVDNINATLTKTNAWCLLWEIYTIKAILESHLIDLSYCFEIKGNLMAA